MNFTRDGQTVTIDIAPEHTKLGVMFSGGVESTLLLYMLAKKVSEEGLTGVSIIPIHGEHVENEDYISPSCVATLDRIQEAFPDIDIQEIHFFRYSRGAPGMGETVEAIIGEKQNTDVEIAKTLKQDGEVDVFYNGRNANSNESTIAGDNQAMMEAAELHRSTKNTQPDNIETETIRTVGDVTVNLLRPFEEVDKKWTVGMYYDLQITDILEGTVSCPMFITTTEPCGECWSCTEREWAINQVTSA